MSEICPKCGKRVYQAEWVVGLGKHYHAPCLTCTNCNKRLNTSDIVDHDDKPYCKNCYSKLYGPVGFGTGRSSYADQTEVKKQLETAGRPVNAAPGEPTPEQLAPHPTPAPKESAPSVPSSAPPSAAPQPKPKAATFGPGPNGDICPTCGKKVYAAEGLNALGRKYHTICFKCYNCHTHLTLGKQFEHEGQPYCQNCSNSLFRIKGYGTGAHLTTY